LARPDLGDLEKLDEKKIMHENLSGPVHATHTRGGPRGSALERFHACHHAREQAWSAVLITFFVPWLLPSMFDPV